MGSMQEAAVAALSMEDAFNLRQKGCISPLSEKVLEISAVTLVLKGMGISLQVHSCRCRVIRPAN